RRVPTGHSSTDDSSHDPVQPHPTDPFVTRVHDIQAAIRPYRYSSRGAQLRLRGEAAIATELCRTRLPSACDGAHDAICPDAPDPVCVCDIQTAICPYSDPSGRKELCLGRGTTIPTGGSGTLTLLSIPRYRCNDAIRPHLTNAVVPCVSDI